MLHTTGISVFDAHSASAATRRRGVSLTETVFATLLVGVLLAASMSALTVVLRTRQAAMERGYGAMLAEQLLEEINSMPYADPQSNSGLGREFGESGATRAQFDDVDDYDNWDSPSPVTKQGVAIAGFTGWRREVDVGYAERITGSHWPWTNTGLKRITVTVTFPGGTPLVRSGFRSRRGALEQELASSTTVVNAIAGRLQLGNAGAKACSTTHLVNHAVDAPPES